MKKVVCVFAVSIALVGCKQDEQMSQRELMEYCGYDKESVNILENERGVDFSVTGKSCNTKIVYVEDDLDQETMSLDSDTTTAMLASGAAGLMLGHLIRGADALDDLDDALESKKKYNRVSTKTRPKKAANRPSTPSKATSATNSAKRATPTKKKRSLMGAITGGAKNITNKVKSRTRSKSSYSSSSRSRSYSSRRR